MVGCTAQGVSISRSCAMSYCEPCQSLTAAALSRRWRVPQGNFEGATYVVSASVMIIEDGAQFFCMKSQINVCVRKKSAFADFFDVSFSRNYCYFCKFVLFSNSAFQAVLPFKFGFQIILSFQKRFSKPLYTTSVVDSFLMCRKQSALYLCFQMTNCHLMSRFAKVK